MNTRMRSGHLLPSTVAVPASAHTITGKDFVVLSDDWNGLPTSTIHLFRHILPRNRVFWLRIVNRWPRMNWADATKVARVLIDQRVAPSSNSKHPAITGRHSPIIHTPLMIPSFHSTIRRFNHSSITRTFHRICEAHNVESPILVTTFPSTADFVRSADAKLKIYYCVDDWLNYPGLDHTRLAAMEHQLFRTVDAVVATSRNLEQKKRPGCPSLYLPQGVDFDHFHQRLGTDDLIPKMAAIKKPIVGFFGLISEWIDLELIIHLSQEFPAVSFVLIGNSDVPTESLSTCPNIHQMGPVKYDDLPRWARYFDVGLIPFVLNDLTKAVNPLKLLEYYALGLPVLSTRLPDLEDTSGPLFLASDHKEFRKSLQLILASDQDRLSPQAVAVARQHSWQHRLEKLSTFIQDLF